MITAGGIDVGSATVKAAVVRTDNQGADEAVVKDVVQQQEDVHHACMYMNGGK